MGKRLPANSTSGHTLTWLSSGWTRQLRPRVQPSIAARSFDQMLLRISKAWTPHAYTLSTHLARPLVPRNSLRPKFPGKSSLLKSPLPSRCSQLNQLQSIYLQQHVAAPRSPVSPGRQENPATDEDAEGGVGVLERRRRSQANPPRVLHAIPLLDGLASQQEQVISEWFSSRQTWWHQTS